MISESKLDESSFTYSLLRNWMWGKLDVGKIGCGEKGESERKLFAHLLNYELPIH